MNTLNRFSTQLHNTGATPHVAPGDIFHDFLQDMQFVVTGLQPICDTLVEPKRMDVWLSNAMAAIKASHPNSLR